jgi:NO-binding membrane sensor protein with MHYT domain
MNYNLVLTLLSAFPAIFASYLAFYFANRANSTHWPSVISGIIMGLGISAMHYVGMAAMEMKVSFIYRPWLFFASIAIAIIVSYVAIYVLSTLQKYMGNQLIKIVTSIIMGFAITSMHYTGMSSVIFYVRGPLKPIHSVHEMAMPLLITSVTVGIAILLNLVLQVCSIAMSIIA